MFLEGFEPLHRRSNLLPLDLEIIGLDVETASLLTQWDEGSLHLVFSIPPQIMVEPCVLNYSFFLIRAMEEGDFILFSGKESKVDISFHNIG